MRSISILGLALLATAALGCGDDDGVVGTDSGVVADSGGVMTDGGSVMTDGGGVMTDGGSVPRDAGGGGSMDAGSGGGDAGPIDPRCAAACVATLAAACPMGPPTQAACATECQMLLTGMCATQLTAYLTCGEGMALTCDAGGNPILAACPTQRAAFEMCLGG